MKFGTIFNKYSLYDWIISLKWKEKILKINEIKKRKVCHSICDVLIIKINLVFINSYRMIKPLL
jgi:hypothetical protein